MKFLKLSALGLGGLLVTLTAVGLLLPSEVHVERTIEITAPACNVYTLLDNFDRFQEWSPWAKIDLSTKYTYAGPPSGVGASMSWKSDHPEVGNGVQTIESVAVCERVTHSLAFEGQGASTASLLLRPGVGNGTKVVWTLDTDFGYNLIGRYFGLGFDGMIGPAYESGLASLKGLAEAGPQTDFAGLTPVVVDVAATPVLFVNTRASRADGAWATALGEAYGRIGVYMETEGYTQAGPPVAVITAESDDGYTIEAGIPFKARETMSPPTDAQVRVGGTPQGHALEVVYKGPYAGLEPLRAKLTAYMTLRKLKRAGPIWEVYVSDPGLTPPADVETDVYVLIKPRLAR